MARVNIGAGTYEGFFHGFQVIKNEEGGYKLQHIYASPAHTGCITSLTLSNKYGATGGKDEAIHIYNIQSKSQIGSLTEHQGTITCLQIWDNSHLFSGSEDGNLCIWKTGGSWQLLRTLKGHKRGITSLAVHPSGKLAITVSKDKTVRTWNLITGLKAYITNLTTAGELVLWSNNGELYVIVCGSIVNVYALEKANIINTIDYGKKINSVVFIDDGHLAIGGEGGEVQIHKVDSKTMLPCSFTAHENGRIKGLAKLTSPSSKKKIWLATATSDGTVKLWKLHRKLNSEPELLSETSINQRITCLSAEVLGVPEEPSTSVDDPDDVIEEIKEEVKLDEEDDDEEEIKEVPHRQTKKRKISSDNIKPTASRDSLTETPISSRKVKNKKK